MATLQENKAPSTLRNEALIAISAILALGLIIYYFGASMAKSELMKAGK